MEEELYNYDTFRRHMMKEDLEFRGGPEPGRLAPDFDLSTVDRGRFRLSDYRNKKPVRALVAGGRGQFAARQCD